MRGRGLIKNWSGSAWRADPGVRACSYAARGLWCEMLWLMAESDRRGYLQQASGSPLSPEQLARMTGGSAEEVTRLLQELEDSGVYSRTDQGVIYNRRMVRDERKSSLCAQAGKKGGGSPRLKVTSKRPSKGSSKGAPKGGFKGEAECPPEQRVAAVETVGSGDAPIYINKENTRSKSSPKKGSFPGFQDLMKFLFESIGPVADPGAQGKSINWLLEHAYTVDECQRCLIDQRDNWTQGRVSWLSVQKHIGIWKQRQTRVNGTTQKHTNESRGKIEERFNADDYRPASKPVIGTPRSHL